MALSYYTMGGRHARGLERYFQRLESAFRTIRPLLARDALVVQLRAAGLYPGGDVNVYLRTGGDPD